MSMSTTSKNSFSGRTMSKRTMASTPYKVISTSKDNNGEYIEFKSSSSLYTDPDKNGHQKLIKANIETRISIYTSDIQGHEEVFSNTGVISKSLCKIYHRNLGPLIIRASYDQITSLKQADTKNSKQIGFTNK